MKRIVSAGGVLLRNGSDGRREVCIILQARWGDWTLPKGKIEKGEHLVACALREVLEETGCSATVIDYLGSISYFVEANVPKSVHFWAMELVDSEAQPPDGEADGIVWVPIDDVMGHLSWDADRSMVRAYLDPTLRMPPPQDDEPAR